jgi:hypothetical protein
MNECVRAWLDVQGVVLVVEYPRGGRGGLIGVLQQQSWTKEYIQE